MRSVSIFSVVLLCLNCGGSKVQAVVPPAPDVKIGGETNAPVHAPKNEDGIAQYWAFAQKPKLAAHVSNRRFRASPAAKLVEEKLLKQPGEVDSAITRCERALFLHVDEALVGGDLGFGNHGDDDKKVAALVVVLKHDGAPELVMECAAAIRKEGEDGSVVDPSARINKLDKYLSVAMEGTYVILGTHELVLEALKKPAMPLPEVLRSESADTFFRGETEVEGIVGRLTGTTNSARSMLAVEASSNTVHNMVFDQVLSFARIIDSVKPATLDLTVKVEGSERISAELAFVGDAEQQRTKMGTLFFDALGLFGAVSAAHATAPAEPHDSVQRIAVTYHVEMASQAARAAAAKASGRPTKPFRFTSFPAVPKTIPRGVKVQVEAKDWKAWSALGFERIGTQEYQYEIVAAPDGKSAQIIARGDLNGDGKASTYVQTLKLNASGGVETAPNIAETNPGE
jgi:hypothetical protein